MTSAVMKMPDLDPFHAAAKGMHSCMLVKLKTYYNVWTLQELYHFSLSPLGHGYALHTIKHGSHQMKISSYREENFKIPQLKAVTCHQLCNRLHGINSPQIHMRNT